MTCYVAGCLEFAKRCWRTTMPTEGRRSGVVVHACADHWPKVVG